MFHRLLLPLAWTGALWLCAPLEAPPAWAQSAGAPATAATSSTGQASALEAAQALLARGDAAAAEAAFRGLLVDAPDLGAALLGRSAALVRLGRAEEALPPILRAAERRLRRGADLDAAELLERAAEILPSTAVLYTQLGDALLRARQFLRAETALRRAVALEAPAPRTLHLLAAALWENGDLEGAEGTYRSLVAADAADADAWLELGRLLAWRGRPAEALAAFERVSRLGDDSPQLRGEVARALEAARRHEQVDDDAAVERAYAAAVEWAPDDYQLRYGWARALLRSGNRAAATVQMTEFQRLYQQHQERTRLAGLEQAQLDRARELLRQERLDETLRVLEELAPSADTHHVRALTLLASGDVAGARRELEAAVGLAPERADLRALLYQVRQPAGR